MYRLVFDQRTGDRAPFTTRAPLLVIGRRPDCALRLLENGITDRHAAIERGPDGYYLRALGTPGAVRVNDQPVTVQRLATGDELELGAARLKFEVVHQPPPRRRGIDLLQLAAGAVVSLLLVGQVWLFAGIFSIPRWRKMRMEIGSDPRGLTLEPATLQTPAGITNVAVTPPAPAIPVAPAAGTVLNRWLRILKVTRADTATNVTVRVEVQAGVGERELDAAATAVSVRFYRQGDARTGGQPVPLDWLWLRTTQWENFTAKTFAARFNGAPAQLAGYVVRTHYRNQVQDERADPPALAAAGEKSR